MRLPVRGILLILPLLCTGCILIPIPHEESTLAVRPGISHPDHARFIQADVTTRTDVLLQLGEPDFAWDHDRIFLYHWSTTDFAVLWAVGGYGSGNAGVYDLPKDHDLLIQFNSAGRVCRSEIVHGAKIDELSRTWPVTRPTKEGP